MCDFKKTTFLIGIKIVANENLNLFQEKTVFLVIKNEIFCNKFKKLKFFVIKSSVFLFKKKTDIIECVSIFHAGFFQFVEGGGEMRGSQNLF